MPPRTGGDGPARRARSRGGRGAGPEPTEPPDGLSALLAALGAHLERHSPAGVAVLLRSELERREFLAYANGWRDAADRYEPAPEQARRIAGSRRLRLVGSTPGRPAVIPFRQDAPASAADEGAPAATPAPARRAPDTATAAERAEREPTPGRAPTTYGGTPGPTTYEDTRTPPPLRRGPPHRRAPDRWRRTGTPGRRPSRGRPCAGQAAPTPGAGRRVRSQEDQEDQED
ncbi:hypothetical protein ACIPMU_00745 [Streptomyces cyaneofuscatus]|uniref:hypothetical protein n=1 Tax=Streptomyces cyaneofuscatus TaxID=66883 RepID=UPI003816D99A